MGIFCEINLSKPSDGVYQPGQTVAGIIKYALDEALEVESIVTSLKGTGSTHIEVSREKNETDTYTSREVYVDIDNVVQATKGELLVGSYEVKFNFNLPHNIPPSLYVKRSSCSETAKCTIKYYIRIKFNKCALFSLNRHFRKEITVVSQKITPTLLKEPVIYGERKKIFKLFSTKNNLINIKATILNSVIPIGGKINVHYEVENDSDVLVKSTKTKLIEVYKFITPHHNIEMERDVLYSTSKTTSIMSRCKENIPTEIEAPSDVCSLDNSAIISRHYKVRMIVELPMPHINAILNIPVQIGTINEEVETLGDLHQDIVYDDPPPSYWEAMGEEKKDPDS